jgi:hypothetical protein
LLRVLDVGHLEFRAWLVLPGRTLIAEPALVEQVAIGGPTLVTDGKLALDQLRQIPMVVITVVAIASMLVLVLSVAGPAFSTAMLAGSQWMPTG